jgi:hypothetical protein
VNLCLPFPDARILLSSLGMPLIDITHRHDIAEPSVTVRVACPHAAQADAPDQVPVARSRLRQAAVSRKIGDGRDAGSSGRLEKVASG